MPSLRICGVRSPRIHAGCVHSAEPELALKRQSRQLFQPPRITRGFGGRHYGSPEHPRTLWSLPKARTLATLGGWPTQLIDEPLPKGQLVVTLFADEEPRRHVVFTEAGRFEVYEEVT